MGKKPVRPSQGAVMFSLPCFSSSPSDAEPAGRPKPRKSREVSAVMAPESVKGRKVMVATMALGSTWRNMMRSEEHTSELQSLMRISYAVFCLKKKKDNKNKQHDISRE